MFESMQGFTMGLAATNRASAARFSETYALSFLRVSERQRIERFLSTGNMAVLFLIEVGNFFVFQNLFGKQVGQRIQDMVEEELGGIVEEMLGECALSYLERLEPGRFVVLCGREFMNHASLPDLALAFRLRIRSRLKAESIKLTGQGLDVLAGYAVLNQPGRGSFEHSIYNALCDAQRVAQGTLDTDQLSLMGEFRSILENGRLSTRYQPIVEFDTGRIIAWEALTRGPEGSYFEMPSHLFDFAEDMDQVFALEKVCRETAIRNLGGLSADQFLFLNIHPRTLVDPDFSPGETRRLLEKNGLSPASVVFEITERHQIRDFTLFHRTLDHYRSQGFKVAVDDVGTGYSGLWSIAELRPDFIKLDMSLIRGIDTNPVKRALLETFVTFADKIGCRLIAEGIETDAELSSLTQMRVHLGQGYHLGRPAFPKPEVDVRMAARLSARTRAVSSELKCSIPLRELAEPAYAVDASTRVSEVKRILQGSEPISAVVVMEGDKPAGLIMSHHLDRALSSPYGISLYYNKSVVRIMDPAPLVVESRTAIEKVARQAMGRDKYKIYDHIIVAGRDGLTGIVSVQKILDTLAAVQVEMAKGANPLTGLPGNVAIEQELEARAGSGASFSIIYCDLDNFKAYNDTYGFNWGDDVLLLLGRIVGWAARRHGSREDFVGHVGGDDFVIITRQDRAERVARAVTRCFGRLVRGCFSPEDREKGYLAGRDRSGSAARFPLVAVSLAIVDCMGCCDLNSIGQRSAEMKTYAKSIPGNIWVRDRRTPGFAESDAA